MGYECLVNNITNIIFTCFIFSLIYLYLLLNATTTHEMMQLPRNLKLHIPNKIRKLIITDFKWQTLDILKLNLLPCLIFVK